MDEAHVVLIDLSREQIDLVTQRLMQELLDIDWINLRLFLWEAHCRHEVARVDLKIVVEDDKWALLLQTPDLGVEFRVFDFKKLLVHRVVGQQSHIVGGCLHDTWRAELSLDIVTLVLEVFEVLLLEGLVLEEFVRFVEIGPD